jgi:hypothetical protein
MPRFEGTLYTEMIFTNTPTLKSQSPPPHVQCLIKFKKLSPQNLRICELPNLFADRSPLKTDECKKKH